MCNFDPLEKRMRIASSGKKVRFAGLFLFLVGAAAYSDASPADFDSFVAVSSRTSENTFREYDLIRNDEGGDREFVRNEEAGAIDHLSGALHWQFDSGVFFEVTAERGKGILEYRGYDQVFQFIQLQTEYVISNQSLSVGRDFGKHAAYIGIGNRYRERNIINGKLYEELSWRYGLFGMRKDFHFGQRWQLNFNAELSVALDSQLKVEFAGTFDPIEIEPGQIASGLGGVELQYKFTPKFSISVGPRYEFSLITESDKYEKSRNNKVQFLTHHPKTEYETISWQFTLMKHF